MTEPEETDAESGSVLRDKLEGSLNENANLKERLAFVEANVDPESEEARIISRSMGDLDMTAENVTTTREGLRAAFTPNPEATPVPPEPDPEPQPGTSREDAVAAQRARTDLTGAGGEKLPEPPDQDIVEGSYDTRRQMLANGAPTPDANSVVSDAIFADAVANGNQSTRVWEGWDRQAAKEEAKR